MLPQKNPLDAARAPGARAWRKKNEGLKPECTAKGSKEGATVVKILVGITHGKGVTLCQRVAKEQRLIGAHFADIVRSDAFQPGISASVNPNEPTILQDNCPVQNSKAARRAFEDKGISLFPIPPRSPDLNCIENLFQQMKQVLRRQARRDTITNESQEAFSARVQDALNNFDTAKIDKLIDSMPKRVDEIVSKNGERLNY